MRYRLVRVGTVLLLGALMALAAIERALKGPGAQASALPQVVWDGFLFGIPLILSGFLLARHRWALMAGVMYGTIGLALDISTIVQALPSPDRQSEILTMSIVTGLLNFLLIVLGGRGFLDVDPVTLKERPPEAPPPSPPSPSAT
jgi:peptidoglycan/LPS O-acetylase OafA/YrhL